MLWLRKTECTNCHNFGKADGPLLQDFPRHIKWMLVTLSVIPAFFFFFKHWLMADFLLRHISFPLESFSFPLDFARCWSWTACLSLHHPPKNPTQPTKYKQNHKQQSPPKLRSPNSCKVFCLGPVFWKSKLVYENFHCLSSPMDYYLDMLPLAW